MKYTVQPGDTLWDISKKILGDPTRWDLIYRANFKIIKHEQRSRNLTRRVGPNWIFPGTTLLIPV